MAMTVGEKCEFDGSVVGWLAAVQSETIVTRNLAVGAGGSGLVDTWFPRRFARAVAEPASSIGAATTAEADTATIKVRVAANSAGNERTGRAG